MYRKYKRASYRRKRAIYKRRAYKRRAYKKRAYRARPEVKQANLIIRGNGTASDNITTFSQLGKPIQNTPFSGVNPASTAFPENNIVPLIPQYRNIVAGSAACWMPNILQGTGQSGRIGNKIVFKGMKINIQILPNAYNASINPFPTPGILRCFIISNKYRPTEPLDATFLDDLFQDGNATAKPIGSIQDAYTEFNRDKYMVLRDYKFKVGNNFEGNFADAGTLARYQQFSNNDFKLVNSKTFKLRKGIKKVHVFNDNASGTPNNLNRLWQMVFLWCPFSGGLIDNTITTPCSIQANVRFYYVDP